MFFYNLLVKMIQDALVPSCLPREILRQGYRIYTYCESLRCDELGNIA